MKGDVEKRTIALTLISCPKFIRNQNASFLLLDKLFSGVEEVEAKTQLSQKSIILYIGVLSKYII